MSGAVLSVSNLSKKYSRNLRRSLRYALSDVARELWPRSTGEVGLRKGEFWALDDVSFELKAGESMAIVGRNGAGKSTLLKLLYGLIKPDRGEVRIRGRTEALIELGTGFNGLLSGRENIRVGAVLHGLDGRRTERLVDEVADFAGLEQFIDAPFQSYSTGMRTRLAYALASHLNPDLLLVDEVLAVGDVSFQRKCFAHMRSYLQNGGALLLVSHNVYQVQALCQEGLLLDHGRTVFTGTAVESINRMFEMARAAEPAPAAAADSGEDVVIEALEAVPTAGTALRTGEEMRVTIRYRSRARVDAAWGFGIWTEDEWICVAGAYQEGAVSIGPGGGTLTCLVPRLPLLPGRYSMRAALVDPKTRYPMALFGWKSAALSIDVTAEPNVVINGLMRLNQLTIIDAEWQ